MVITILEGKLTPAQADKLQALYRETAKTAPPGLVSYCLNDQKDRSVWRIATVWKAQKELDDMLASGVTPKGRAMFQEAGVEPTLRVWDVPERIG